MSRRGRTSKFNHKGRARCFTAPDEMQRQFEKAKRQDDEEEVSAEENSEKSSDSNEEEEVVPTKQKGLHGLIEIENPNRIPVKPKKDENIDSEPKVQLSRKEKEAIEKERATQRYELLHSQGKTEEARKDLERLALIKQKREELAAKKKLEAEAKDLAKNASTFKKKPTQEAS